MPGSRLQRFKAVGTLLILCTLCAACGYPNAVTGPSASSRIVSTPSRAVHVHTGKDAQRILKARQTRKRRAAQSRIASLQASDTLVACSSALSAADQTTAAASFGNTETCGYVASLGDWYLLLSGNQPGFAGPSGGVLAVLDCADSPSDASCDDPTASQPLSDFVAYSVPDPGGPIRYLLTAGDMVIWMRNGACNQVAFDLADNAWYGNFGDPYGLTAGLLAGQSETSDELTGLQSEPMASALQTPAPPTDSVCDG